MEVAWPATLPAPIANSVKLHTQKNTRTIEFSAKNRRTTTRASKPPSIVECEISMDSVQLDAFDYFIKFDLSYGAHWIDANWLLPLGFSAHFARFLELPKINKRGGRFTVSCVFEIVLQSVAVQMPNAMAYPASNVQPGPPIPQLDLVATYDASSDIVGTQYAHNDILPDANGSGFRANIHAPFVVYYSNTYAPTLPPQTMPVVNLSGINAVRLYTSHGWDGSYNNVYLYHLMQSQNAFSAAAPNFTIMIGVVPAPIRWVGVAYATVNSFFTGWNGNRAVLTYIENSITQKCEYYINGTLVNNLHNNYMHFNNTRAPYFGNHAFINTTYYYIHECMLWSGPNPMTTQQHADLVSYLMTKWLII